MNLYYFSVQTGRAQAATTQHLFPNVDAARQKAMALAVETAVDAERAGLDGEAVVITIRTDAAGVLFTLRLAFNIEAPQSGEWLP